MALLLAGGLAWAADGEDTAGYLQELWKFSEREHAAQIVAAQKPLVDLQSKYATALLTFRDHAQAAGNLKKVVAANKALATLDAGETIGGSEDSEVANLERIYLKSQAPALAAARQGVLKADQTYLATLTSLVGRLTKAGQIDQAVEAQSAADGLAARMQENLVREPGGGEMPEVVVASSFVPQDGKGKATPRESKIPPAAIDDAAAKATLKLLSGKPYPLSGPLNVLVDGKMPSSENSPPENFFFESGGGRLTMDLGRVMAIRSVASYSRHVDVRGPQNYVLFVADGLAPDFNAAPERGLDPTTCGWKRLAEVDTRRGKSAGGGRHSVQIADKNNGSLGKFRYLLFDILKTGADPHAETFFSEIDVIEANVPLPTRLDP